MQVSQPFLTASETMSFCAHRELVPAYRSMSAFCWSLKPRTVNRAHRRASFNQATSTCIACGNVPLELHNPAHIKKISWAASRLAAKALELSASLQFCEHAFIYFGPNSFSWAGVRMSSSRCTTTCRTVLGAICNSTISPDCGFLGRWLRVFGIGGYTASST